VTDAVDRVDAAIVATPTVTHLDAARPFIEAGKNVLVEKPFTDDPAAGEELIALAAKTNTWVQVGHTERFNPASVALQKYDIRPKFIEAHRISPFTFRSADVGVVLDMMIHDIDLVLMLAGSDVTDIQAVGVNVIGKTEDICNARLKFANGCVANITASRLAIKTERKMRIFSDQAYVSVDYGKKVGIVIQKEANLDLIDMARELDVDDIAELAQSVDYTKLLNVQELTIDESMDPLTRQASAFRRTVEQGEPPLCSASEGLQAVRVAQTIVDTLQAHRWEGESGESIIRK
jgi:predicted dehydrogenase